MKRILVLSANPQNTSQLRLAEEVREIDEGLRRSSHREQFELISRGAVRLQDFRRHMLEVKPHLLHFSGHGAGEHGLVLEDDSGKAHFLETEQLAAMFKLFANRGLECVLLNACYSEIQAKAINQAVPYVIGMNQAIGDRAAVTFAVAFYDTLGAGEPIDFAFELAKTQLIGLREDQKLVLFTNPDAVLPEKADAKANGKADGKIKSPQNSAAANPDAGEQVLKLLQILLPSQFEQVVFKYKVPPSHLSVNTPQSQRSIEVIRYAEQKEGESLTQLLTVIYQVAPHLEAKHG
ncbi:CHAT domain-containing protein [Leptolyngbya ohadii]|uniref:CHAT domain-containing protein n=1 Tax=Leptolyngbya ohadii TaxID=1962290 RepID=UPI000B59BE9B|nr:CHAT domain-containing protein [Leptolyngbya ohadii]